MPRPSDIRDRPPDGSDLTPSEHAGADRYGPRTALTRSQTAILIVVPCVGILAIVIFSAQFIGTQFLSVLGVGLLTASASMFCGALLGLLFGIPRSASVDDENSASLHNAAYVANTNLEQISDWLTKILVGVGLVELGNIATGVGALTRFLAPGLGDQPSSAAIALSLLSFFSVWGFFVGYMFARTHLPGLFRVADEDALRAVTEVRAELVAVREKADNQEDFDVRALSLSGRLISGSAGEDETISIEDLSDAFSKASRTILIQIFTQAEVLRARTWRTEKSLMERCIPVFRALISVDHANRFHRNYGQLGFALHDQSTPNYAEALECLNKAIQIRDANGERGWRFYELVRASCRIKMDRNFSNDLASDGSLQNMIESDLRAGAASARVRSVIRTQEPFPKWRKINGQQPI